MVEQSTPEENLDGYLVAEYKNIAEAHFRTNEGISSFFRYYLLIMSAPITVLAVFISLAGNLEEIADIIQGFNLLVFAILLVISLVGFSVMLYIINLRMDVILYARTVNAIRKHFYDKAKEISVDTKLLMRALPQSRRQPEYKEYPYFGPVVSAFAFFNTFYLTSAIAIHYLSFEEITGTIKLFSDMSWGMWFIPVGFFSLHFISYLWYARHREHTYLRSFAVGVDIDGVLNKHRQHFCKLLKDNTGIQLEPESITTIPLHDCPALGVLREDENQVFNDPRYWTEMLLEDDAAHNLQRIKNLNIKIYFLVIDLGRTLSRCKRKNVRRFTIDGVLLLQVLFKTPMKVTH